MSYGDDQDVWAEVCAEDTAAAGGPPGGAEPQRATGSTTASEEPGTAKSPSGQAGSAGADADAARADVEPAQDERRREPAGLTGIPEVDQIADEARKLIGSLTDRAKDLRRYQEQRQPTPIEEAVRLLVPLRSRSPETFDHLMRAGVELVRAYQAAVRNHEKRWANERPRRREHISLDDSDDNTNG